MIGRSFLRQLTGRGVLLGVFCALASWFLTRPLMVRGIEEWLFDGWFYARDRWFHSSGPRPTQAKVVLVTLDDRSLNQLDKPAAFLSPELAEVVTCLREHGAAAIGVDIIVPESLENNRDFERLLQADRMGQAVVNSGNVVLANWFLQDGWLLPLTPWRLKALGNSAEPTDLGFVNLDEDEDQFIRQQRLYELAEQKMHFALALYSVASGLKVQWRNGLWVGGQRVPLDDQQRLRINFIGPPGSFPTIPFHEVLAAARDRQRLPEYVAGAVAIIGVTAQSQQDYHPTPYSNKFYRRLFSDDPGLMSGPELHANILATLADRAYLTTPPWPVTLTLLLVIGPLLGAAFARLNLELGFLLALAHHFAWKGISFLMFGLFHLRIEMVAMLLLGFLAYACTFCLRWWRLRRMLGVVKSEAIAQAMEAEPAALRLKGDRREVSVLFADIRNFTDFAADHTPQQVVALLNEYFTAIVPIIEEYGGTLNVYMGDGIMVIFNAPADQPDHAQRAVRAAVAVVERVHEKRADWAKLTNPTFQWPDPKHREFRIGVGIHMGEAVVGYVGSPRRLDYTAIGNTVNAAARIEAENKRWDSEILLSAQTVEALPLADRAKVLLARLPDPVQVKGIPQALNLYRIDRRC